jgi:putative sigma-54 modulation protein
MKPPAEALHVSVTGRNMPVTPALDEYAVAKMSRLTRYLDRLSRVEVVLSSEHARESSRRNLAEATATVRGRVVRAESSEADMYAAIDGVVDKLHLQLTKFKERSRSHKGRGPGESLDIDVVGGPDETITSLSEDSSDSDARIVEVKQYTMKPMFADEAIDAMEEMGHTFFVFLDARTEQVSVVYRRRDGAYGLIEPAFD